MRKWNVTFEGSLHTQRIWNPELGEVNIAKRERENSHDRSAVAILEEDTWAFATGDLQRAFLFAINEWSNQT